MSVNINGFITQENEENKGELQSKTILELQQDIREFQKKERAYLIKIHLKDKDIRNEYPNMRFENELDAKIYIEHQFQIQETSRTSFFKAIRSSGYGNISNKLGKFFRLDAGY